MKWRCAGRSASRPALVRQLLTESVMLALAGGRARASAGDGWPFACLFVSGPPERAPPRATPTLDGRATAVALRARSRERVCCSVCCPRWQVAQARRCSPDCATAPAARPPAPHGVCARFSLPATWQWRRSCSWAQGCSCGASWDCSPSRPASKTDRVLTGRVSLAGAQYRSDDNASNIAATVRFYDEAARSRPRRCQASKPLPAVTTLPLGGNIDGYGLHVVGRPLANPESAPSADRFVVTPGSSTLGIRLCAAGCSTRPIAKAPRRPSSTTRSRAVLPRRGCDRPRHQDRGPIGAPARTIVGIVNDVRHIGLETPQTNQVYVPQAQWVWAETGLTLVVRASHDPLALAASIRKALRAIDPAQPLTDGRAYDDIVPPPPARAASRRAADRLRHHRARARRDRPVWRARRGGRPATSGNRTAARARRRRSPDRPPAASSRNCVLPSPAWSRAWQ